jgi:hypothetical protein
MRPEGTGEVLGLIREYRDIAGGLHQRLDFAAMEDSSRVRHRNAILVLGILRRSMMGHLATSSNGEDAARTSASQPCRTFTTP